jgi:hypothetical protein
MKTRIALVIILLVSVGLRAQNLSWTSNEIHLDFKQPQVASSIPFVTWIKPVIDYSSSQETRVHILAQVSADAGLRSVVLRVGNAAIGEEPISKDLHVSSVNSYTVDLHVNLNDGTNFIEIIAENQQGAKVTARRKMIIGKDALDYISADRKDYALIFATDNYDHWDDLVNPVNDGQAIAKELREKYGFETEIIENATVEQVFEKIRDYNTRKFKPQDQLLIFFAGHGMFDETFGEGYVVASNSLANDKSRTSYIAHSRLRGVVNNIPCQHILLMMDVCFGGTLDPVIARARSAADEVSEREMLARKFSHKTRKYLTSGGKEYVSDGVPGQHSPFAARFIESLRSYGGEDRILTLSELQVSMEKLRQVPRFGSFGDDEQLSDFVFIVKSN